MSTIDNSFFLQKPPSILFRVLHNGNTGFDHEGNLPVGGPMVPVTTESLDNHLSWRKVISPFLSFCTYQKAQNFIKFLRSKRYKDITLIAIDSSNMRNIIAFYNVARSLGYKNDHADERRQLRNHWNEYLIYGGYNADLYKLLIVISGREMELPEPTRGICYLIVS